MDHESGAQTQIFNTFDRKQSGTVSNASFYQQQEPQFVPLKRGFMPPPPPPLMMVNYPIDRQMSQPLPQSMYLQNILPIPQPTTPPIASSQDSNINHLVMINYGTDQNMEELMKMYPPPKPLMMTNSNTNNQNKNNITVPTLQRDQPSTTTTFSAFTQTTWTEDESRSSSTSSSSSSDDDDATRITRNNGSKSGDYSECTQTKTHPNFSRIEIIQPRQYNDDDDDDANSENNGDLPVLQDMWSETMSDNENHEKSITVLAINEQPKLNGAVGGMLGDMFGVDALDNINDHDDDDMIDIEQNEEDHTE
eukprot:39179_1